MFEKLEMKSLLKIILILIIALSGIAAYSQQPFVNAGLDTTDIRVGDRFNFFLELGLPAGTPYQWPVFYDTLTGNIEIIETSRIDTVQVNDENLLIRQNLSLTIFDTGFYVIPPIPFFYGDDLKSVVESEPFLINVFSVGVDVNQPFKPIKGPVEAPLTIAEILPWVLAALILFAVIFALVKYLKRKKPEEKIIFRKPKPKIPPYQTAFAELEKLKNEKLWQRDLIKDYHTRLTDILRQYIEDGYRIPAHEQTTFEIIHSFSSVKIESRSLSLLRETLEVADLVKFAKYKPISDQHIKSMNNALEFVKQTKAGIVYQPAVSNNNDTSNRIENETSNSDLKDGKTV
jgi:hypothetical protein